MRKNFGMLQQLVFLAVPFISIGGISWLSLGCFSPEL